MVEQPSALVGLVAFASVDDDLGFRIYALYRIIALVCKDCEIVGIVADLAQRMQHAAVGLVADLHPFYIDFVVLEQLQSLLCMSLHCGSELIDRERRPCCRGLLV